MKHKQIRRSQTSDSAQQLAAVMQEDTGAIEPMQSDRRTLLKRMGAAGLTMAASPAMLPLAVSADSLQDYRIAQHENVTLYIDFDEMPTGVDLFLIGDPERLVIDLRGVGGNNARPNSYGGGAISAIRFGKHQDKLRMVVDLRQPVSPTYHFVERHNGHRLIVDLGIPGYPQTAAGSPPQDTGASLRDVVIAIDAGHGGKDPGAIGRSKTLEKDITLQVAKKLAARLSRQRGIKVVMTRNSDTYVGLRERTKRARSMNADLFISLHADAFPRRDAKGSSVYALSLKGASSEAASFLAEQENSYDPLVGVDMDEMSADLKRTLIELSQSSSIESSLDVGSQILRHLGNIGAVHKSRVEQANFAVLRSPDIPSVLVETAFISNPGEEKKLRSRRFQQRLALAIESGVMDYMGERAPIDSWLGRQSG